MNEVITLANNILLRCECAERSWDGNKYICAHGGVWVDEVYDKECPSYCINEILTLLKQQPEAAEPQGTAVDEYMHESIAKDAVRYDLPSDEVISALCTDNQSLKDIIDRQAEENTRLKGKLAFAKRTLSALDIHLHSI